ncbi:MAG: DUF3598 family protein [Chroococcidiopsidaceae cyanobacterium CP_BM_RX_35]|nr:DUF3598 family protein [Chroococcidiopsidaceae cyanobacterium CP_BM_RX_35]
MELQLQNWSNFCQYHVGDWHGTWKRYNSKGEITETFQCIRSLRKNIDDSEVSHRNHYTYSDGNSQTVDFGVYKKPTTIPLFLDNNFSMGSASLQSTPYFGFETGFKYKDRGVSAVVVYTESGELQRITTIYEHLASFKENTSTPLINEFSDNWQGQLKIMFPNLRTSGTEKIAYKPLKDLDKNNLIFHFSDGISVSCPQVIAAENVSFTVDWLVNPTLLQRGSRHFEASKFKFFSLETFNLIKETESLS